MMKKSVMSRVWVCVAVCMLLNLEMAMAEGLDCLWVSDDGSRNECAIDWYQDDGQYYLFLPGNMTMNTLCIGFSGVNSQGLYADGPW